MALVTESNECFQFKAHDLPFVVSTKSCSFSPNETALTPFTRLPMRVSESSVAQIQHARKMKPTLDDTLYTPLCLKSELFDVRAAWY